MPVATNPVTVFLYSSGTFFVGVVRMRSSRPSLSKSAPGTLMAAVFVQAFVAANAGGRIVRTKLLLTSAERSLTVTVIVAEPVLFVGSSISKASKNVGDGQNFLESRSVTKDDCGIKSGLELCAVRIRPEAVG